MTAFFYKTERKTHPSFFYGFRFFKISNRTTYYCYEYEQHQG